MARQSDTMLRVIGALKIAKALMLIAAGVGVLSLGSHHVHTLAWNFHHDEANHYINKALSKVSHVSPHRLHELGIGCFVYAALFSVEGVGLWMRKVWAEYVTIVIYLVWKLKRDKHWPFR